MDALIGERFGNTIVQLNQPVAPVTSNTADGTYKLGDIIILTVAFNENVLVTGIPTLRLETGTTDRDAVYTSGSGSRVLTFTYTVQAGDASADLTQLNSTALALNGGTIKDAAGNNAVLTLAAPNATGSLGANKAIVIDGIAPTLSITSSVTAVKTGETATISFAFSEAPTGFTASDITATGGVVSALAVTANPKIYTAIYTPAANTTASASITVAANLYTDAAGNNGGAGTTPTISIDTLAPTVAITSNLGAVKAGETASISFTFSEAPVGFAIGDITATGGAASALAVTADPKVYTATFTPTAGLASGSASITVAALSYADAAGNPGSAGGTPTVTIDTLRPLFATAAVNANQLVMTYTELTTLDAVNTPAAGAFAVKAGDVANAVTGVAINAAAKTVTLTLTTPVAFGQAVTVAYTDPAGDQAVGVIQDAAGNDAITLAATAVTNNTAFPANNPGTGVGAVAPTSSGTNAPQQGDTLSINTSALSDPDGLGPLSFQWLRDGQAIAGATADKYTLGAADVGSAITVAVSYADGLGYAERSVSSATQLIQDNDGIANSVESQAPALLPNGARGDGNGDGVQDVLQLNVTSGVAPGSSSYFTLVADSNKGVTNVLDTNQAILSQVKVDAAPANLPNNLSLNALMSFKADVGTAGTTETFSVFVDASTNANGYWVKDASGTWNNIATAIETVGSKLRIDFAITDGRQFDADGLANGSIDASGGAGQMQLSIIGQPPVLPAGNFWF